MTTCTVNCDKTNQSFGSELKLNQLLSGWISKQMLRNQLKRERQQLLSMSDAMLTDMGISRAQAEAESRSRSTPASRKLH